MQIPPVVPLPSSTRVRISRSTQTGHPPQAAEPAGTADDDVPGSAANPVDVEHAASGAGPCGSKRFRPGAPLTGLLEQTQAARPASTTALRGAFHPACGAGSSTVVQPSAWTLKRKPTGGEFVRGILLRLQQMTAHQRDAVVKALELQLFQNGWRIDDGQLQHLAEVHRAINPRAMSQSPSGSRARPASTPSDPAVPVVANAGSARPPASLLPQPLPQPQPQLLALPPPLPSPMPAASMASDLILNLIFSLRPGAVVQPAATLAFFPPVTGDAVLASLVATGVLLQSADGVLRRSTSQAWLSDEGAPFGDALIGTWRVAPDPAQPPPPSYWQVARPVPPEPPEQPQ